MLAGISVRDEMLRNVRGMLAVIEDTTGEEHTSFDARGRVEWTVKRILDPELSPALVPDPATLVAYKTAFDYDSMDRVTRMIYPDNDEVTYRYNAREELALIDVGAGMGTEAIIENVRREAPLQPIDYLFTLRAAGDRIESRQIDAMINHSTNEVWIRDLRIPAADRIGEEGMGFRYIIDGWNAERILVAAEAIGDGAGNRLAETPEKILQSQRQTEDVAAPGEVAAHRLHEETEAGARAEAEKSDDAAADDDDQRRPPVGDGAGRTKVACGAGHTHSLFLALRLAARAGRSRCEELMHPHENPRGEVSKRRRALQRCKLARTDTPICWRTLWHRLPGHDRFDLL